MGAAYIVIKALDDEKTGGVCNFSMWFNQLEPKYTTILGYPKTRKFGHDMSLLIIMIEGKDPERSAKWFMHELAKKALYAQHSLFMPPPFKRLEYYSIPTLVEMFTDVNNVIPYLQMVNDRIELSKLERVYNDAELAEKFNKVAEEPDAPQI